MKLIEKALEFEKRSTARMSTSDRILASREAKSIVLAINTIYKKTKDPYLMEIMKLVTVKKRKIDKRLKGRSLSTAI
ncbi:hypothetical protein [Seonamhaeicola sp.]|uniref:hypothetical protein n=1 Tax=Seonamhaeicola sp. TaxID=1912245 RepID=UPI00260C9713|nr:hypothetical protein [Seonamhaeicola sp.]